jgi:hypothetical protein
MFAGVLSGRTGTVPLPVLVFGDDVGQRSSLRVTGATSDLPLTADRLEGFFFSRFRFGIRFGIRSLLESAGWDHAQHLSGSTTDIGIRDRLPIVPLGGDLDPQSLLDHVLEVR